MTLFEVLPSLRRGLNRHLDREIWPINADIDERGQLCVGGVATTQIAAQFGTPGQIPPLAGWATRQRVLVCRETVADLLARDRGWAGQDS